MLRLYCARVALALRLVLLLRSSQLLVLLLFARCPLLLAVLQLLVLALLRCEIG
jgi:hypothetical protein